MCLDAEGLILLEELIMLEELIILYNPMPHQRKMWNLRATAVIKNEEILKQNVRSLYTVVMSICDMNMEDKVSCHKEFASIKSTSNIKFQTANELIW